MKVTVDERPQIITEPTEYSLDSFPQKIKANITMQKMKETINSLGANPRNVMKTVLNELSLSHEVQVHMPKMLPLQELSTESRRRQEEMIQQMQK